MPVAVTTAVLWRMRLGSALRAALACAIIGVITVFGPAPVKHLLAFSAFSYVTIISILLSDAVSIGDAVMGVWHVMWAVALVVLSSVPCLWLIRPERFTGSASAAVAVAVSAFMVALPERTHLLTKRIAFGQLVIVYVGTMRKLSRGYTENGCERTAAMVDGLGARSKAEAAASMADAKSLSIYGTKLLQSIKANMGGMIWERSQTGIDIAEKLEEIEVAMRGMEAALTSPSIAFGAMDEELCNMLNDLKPKAILNLQQLNFTTAPEKKPTFSTHRLINISPIIPQILPVSFFLRCMEILLYDSTSAAAASRNLVSQVKIGRRLNGGEATELGDGCTKKTHWGISSNMLPTSKSFCFALKCSITLGLAVYLGLTYTKKNGYWSGLTVAISFATERQAIFTVANARAQGTAMGSIYGVICCFILRKYEYLWLLPLLPWVVFSSFLIHSRMYGQSGGIASALGALLVLGRKNYGIPSEFANARIIEACIGLLCYLTVEVVFNPTRAATLTKTEFSTTLELLQDCIKRVILIPHKNSYESSSTLIPLIEQHKNLKSHVSQLEKFIIEAGFEPNFWTTPFQASCYDNLVKSLQKSVDILQFLVHEMRSLSLELNSSNLSEDMEAFSKKVGCSLKFMEKVSLIKSLKELQSKNQEMEKGSNHGSRALALSEEDIETIMGSFCQHANEILSKAYINGEDEANLKGQMTRRLSSIGFCMECLMRETMAMEKEVHQLLKLENPSIHIDLQELSRKVDAHCA
ncbi:hypothetical protein SDJN03_04272, partial [Cucurbita argyrosperma subsp. sororia]